MDRTSTMRTLAAEFSSAAEGGDWKRLRAAALALPARLEKLAAAGPLSPPERRDLDQLRAAHERATAAVAGAGREAKAALDEMHNNKEGWMAYALNGVAPAAKEE